MRRQRDGQPCLIHLHIIALVALTNRFTANVLGQMGMVLHFQFPPYLGSLIAIFKPLVAAIHGLVALECAGLTGGFYVAWTFEVIVVPCVLWGCVLLYYLSRVATVGHTEAAAKAYNDAFFVLFLAYPVICNKLFKMLDCRQLDADRDVRQSTAISAYSKTPMISLCHAPSAALCLADAPAWVSECGSECEMLHIA